MKYEEARKIIQSHFFNNFTATNKIAWDNEEFAIPQDGSPWVRFSIQNNTSNFVSFGAGILARRRGLVTVQIFVVENGGTLLSTQIVDNVVEVFELNLTTVRFDQSPDVLDIGNRDGWYQVNVVVPFSFDDVIRRD